MVKKPIYGPHKRTTHPLIWLVAVICTVLAIGVIIAGIVVFGGYIAIHPRVPFISVIDAHLDKIQYDLAGLLETQVTILIKAENDNAKAHASFSDTRFRLSFQGLELADLVAEPFEVMKNSSQEFHYVVPSSSIPLNPEQMEDVDLDLKLNHITFDLKGNSKARWKVGLLGSVNFMCRLNCQLKFHPLTGHFIKSHCSSRAK